MRSIASAAIQNPIYSKSGGNPKINKAAPRSVRLSEFCYDLLGVVRVGVVTAPKKSKALYGVNFTKSSAEHVPKEVPPCCGIPRDLQEHN